MNSKHSTTLSNSKSLKQAVLIVSVYRDGCLGEFNSQNGLAEWQGDDGEERRPPVVEKPWDLKGRTSWSPQLFVAANMSPDLYRLQQKTSVYSIVRDEWEQLGSMMGRDLWVNNERPKGRLLPSRLLSSQGTWLTFFVSADLFLSCLLLELSWLTEVWEILREMRSSLSTSTAPTFDMKS